MIVGLTGGIGSGKSTVGSMFKELGIPVYNSDERAKELMHTSKTLRKQLLELFGEEAYINETLNKAFIAEKVFKDSAKLTALNRIVHPAVRKDFSTWAASQKAPYVIQETALLFENKAQKFYDRTILVTAPKEDRIQRVLARDNATRKQVLARMDKQLDDFEKLELADSVIENIDLERTRAEVQKLHQSILADCE